MGLLLALGCLAISVLGQPDNAPYQLIPWRYGVIAWLEPGNSLDPAFAERLEEAVEVAFSFWEMPVPAPGDGWQHPQENERRSALENLPQLLKKDPATGVMWRVNPLSWRDGQIFPLVVVVSPDAQTQQERLGGFDTAAFLAGMAAIRGVDPALLSLLGNPRVMLCHQAEEFSTLVHECAHWFVTEWVMAEGVSAWLLPRLLDEGLAEATSSAYRDDESEARSYLRSWVGSHSLEPELAFEYDYYVVGESFVTYLIKRYGKASFLAQLEAWAANPAEMMAEHEAAWKRAEKLTSPTWLYWLATIGMLIAVLGSGSIVRRISAGRSHRD